MIKSNLFADGNGDLRFDGTRFLITGNTGFIGSWLSLALAQAGGSVFGFSNGSPANFTYFSEDIGLLPITTTFADICSPSAIEREVKKIDPDYVFHLAAQSKVLEGYSDPSQTLNSNLLGTLNTLRAVEGCKSVRGITIFTTDKVYRPSNNPHLEQDPLGGKDPYSSSKAMADQISSYFRRWGGLDFPVTVFRGGNVVGGGDKGQYRLIPDVIRSWLNKERLILRNPDSVRPWQHVMNIVQACMIVAKMSIEGKTHNINTDFNVGPSDPASHSVRELVELMFKHLGNFDFSEVHSDEVLREDKVLLLDSSQAINIFGLSKVSTFEESIRLTSEWYNDVLLTKVSPLDKTLEQIRNSLNGI